MREVPILTKIFNSLASLKLAVVVLLGLVTSLATATILESLYDTQTAQYYIYRSVWFYALLALLGANIFCSAMSRYPWKMRHLPFLVAHVGIMTLLAGSWITFRQGLDGSMRVTEGESSAVVEMENSSLILSEADQLHKVSIPWLPPNVTFKPFNLQDRKIPFDLAVDRFLSHADPIYGFISTGDMHNAQLGWRPALHLRVQGGPMRITQDFWLWPGDPQFSLIDAGPARFAFTAEGAPAPELLAGRPNLFLVARKDGRLSYETHTSAGKVEKGIVEAKKIPGLELKPDWKGVSLTFLEWLPDAMPLATYEPSQIQYGTNAPSSAIHLKAGAGGPGAELWLGLGERAVLNIGGRNIDVGYFPQRVVLPFSLRLEHFKVAHYQGSLDPSSYESKVTVVDRNEEEVRKQIGSPDVTISMNEPLHYKGLTIYQASFEDAKPRPVTSIFAVNRDPGRPWKYAGSLLIVFGTILLFGAKMRRNQQAKRFAPPGGATA